MTLFTKEYDLKAFDGLVGKHPYCALLAMKKTIRGRAALQQEINMTIKISQIQESLRFIAGQEVDVHERLAERETEIRTAQDRAILDRRGIIQEKNKALNDGKIPARVCHTTIFEVCDYTFIP